MAAEKEAYGDELEYTNAEYQEFFDSFDLDGNGTVDQSDLAVVCGSWDAVMEEIYEQCGDDEACWEEAFADL
jgi:Ca2+-binding EF-hand superfamily protein